MSQGVEAEIQRPAIIIKAMKSILRLPARDQSKQLGQPHARVDNRGLERIEKVPGFQSDIHQALKMFFEVELLFLLPWMGGVVPVWGCVRYI